MPFVTSYRNIFQGIAFHFVLTAFAIKKRIVFCSEKIKSAQACVVESGQRSLWEHVFRSNLTEA